MPFSTTETNLILNAMLGKLKYYIGKDEVYIGLLTNDPEAEGAEGVCEEIPAGFDTYERVLISRFNQNLPNLIGEASKREIKSIAQINWTKAKEQDWPEVKGIALYTVKEDGVPFYYSRIPEPFTTPVGAVALFEKGNFKISMLKTDVDIEDEDENTETT